MSSPPSAELTTALDVLAAPRRRYLLATLLEREETPSADPPSASVRLSIDALATEVASVERGCPIVPDERCERVHVALAHVHVPRLVDAGILSYADDDDEPTVALTDHTLLETEWVRSLLADPTGDAFPADEATLDRTLEVLRRPRRRAVCAALAERETVDIAHLAGTIAERDGDGTADVSETAQSTVATALVHEHLPALSEAGLVEYDGAAREVALATDAPQWEADWLTEGPLAAVVDHRLGTQVTDERTGSASVTVDQPAADGSDPDTVPDTDDRMRWTLAQPPVDRTADGRESSTREVANPPSNSSSAASEPTDGTPPT